MNTSTYYCILTGFQKYDFHFNESYEVKVKKTTFSVDCNNTRWIFDSACVFYIVLNDPSYDTNHVCMYWF